MQRLWINKEMTNEQCIAVAEEVWGWELRDWDASDTEKYWMEKSSNGAWSPCSSCEFFISYPAKRSTCPLEAAVNSWQGFGRTWAFFTNKFKHSITIDFCWHEDAQSWACNANLDSEMSYSGYGETQIEAIHNCAIDYLEKSK